MDEEALSRFEKEEKLDVQQEQLIESNYIYFNSTNKGDVLVYNKLSNCLLRLSSNSEKMFEYKLPKLYQLEFSDKPEHLIMYISDEDEKSNETTIFLAYVQDDDINNQKLLVLRKVTLEKDPEQTTSTYSNDHTQLKWIEIDYIETKVQFEHSQTTLRGIIWWEDSSSRPSEGEAAHQDGSCVTPLVDPPPSLLSSSLGFPSILMVTSSRLTLFSLKEHGIQPVWYICEGNLQMWYNMEFQCLVLQTGPNRLTPYINVGMSPQQKPIKLQPLELILNSDLRQRDIFLLNIYQSLYCVHVDYSIKRISLRDLFSQDSPDLVLDIKGSFQEFTLVVIDNVIVVVNLHGKKVLGLFDIKLVKDGSSKGSSKSKEGRSGSGTPSSSSQSNIGATTSSCNYYMIPALFNDELSDNAIVCLYDDSKNNVYLKSLKKIKIQNLSNYSILLVGSSNCIVIKLDLNKIQYSRLNLCSSLLIDSIITSSKDGLGKTASLEKMDMLPFISNRSQSWWDKNLLKKLTSLIETEMGSISNHRGDVCGLGSSDKAYPKSLTLLMEIIKVKLDLKLKVKPEYYDLLLELIFLLGRESLLQYTLQYHIIEDSNKILKELYHVYMLNKSDNHDKQLPNETGHGHVRFSNEEQLLHNHPSSCNQDKSENKHPKYFKINNVSWLEQICLDMAYRLNNLKILVDILMYRKEYKRVIRLLRKGSEKDVTISVNSRKIAIKTIILACSKHCQACKYPIYNILYKLGNDVKLQERDPNLLRDVVREIQKWISDYFNQVEMIQGMVSAYNRDDPSSSCGEVGKYSFSVIGRPNISKCHIWLPELINMNDLNDEDGLMSSQSGDDHHDHCNNDHSNGNASGLDSNRNTNYSTLESIYISATESSNEAFIINSKPAREKPLIIYSSCGNSLRDDSYDGDDSYRNRNNVCGGKTNRNHGKSPLLQYEPGFLASSSMYFNNCSSDSSSCSSSSSSSFNSYE